MASSRKPPSVRPFLAAARGKRIAVALSGGLDSVVLLHLLKDTGVSAVHVHHGWSPHANEWAAFCRRLCAEWGVPLDVHKVKVRRTDKGREAAAREARYAVFAALEADCIALAHHLDDQAETVLMNLLRGTGVRGASGMRALGRWQGKLLARPLLDVPREHLASYARTHGLQWIEDETNADETLTRNFLRRRIAPLIEQRFPRWKSALARAAGHFGRRDERARGLLRAYLESKNLKAPSEAKLVEMLKQLTSGGARTRLAHDGLDLRVYRGRLRPGDGAPAAAPGFAPRPWRGERRLALPELGGELRFRAKKGAGIDPARVSAGVVRLRRGGERFQADPRRPRRTLKNLFQEAGVPPDERARLPLLCCGDDVVWAPGLGVHARYRAGVDTRGLVPEWRPNAAG